MFKKGDIITGIKPTIPSYTVTNSQALMVVIETRNYKNCYDEGKIKVLVLSSSKDESHIGHTHPVYGKYFVKTTFQEFYDRFPEAPKVTSEKIREVENKYDCTINSKVTKVKATGIKLEGKLKFEIVSTKITNNNGTQVMFVEFADGDIQKAVCMPEDTFDAERGLEICVLKHVLGGSNKYHKVLKVAQNQIVAIEDAEQKAKAEAERIAKKKAKAERNKAKRAERRAEKERLEKEAQRAERVADMTEAFSAALKANGVDASVKDVSESVLSKIINAFK